MHKGKKGLKELKGNMIQKQNISKNNIRKKKEKNRLAVNNKELNTKENVIYGKQKNISIYRN